MSAHRLPWGTDEKALLQEVKASNTTAQTAELTKIFNEKSDRPRTTHAVRGQLKAMRRLAAHNDDSMAPIQSAHGLNLGTQSSTQNARDWAYLPRQDSRIIPANTIFIPRHPLILDCPLYQVVSSLEATCSCGQLSILHRSYFELATDGHSRPDEDELVRNQDLNYLTQPSYLVNNRGNLEEQFFPR